MKNEIKPLTGIRGIAAFVVMLYHFINYPPFLNIPMPRLHKGYLCVDLFFILSGFVLGLRYHKHFGVHSSWRNYSDFLHARFARIYPIYFIALFLYYVKWEANVSGTNSYAYTAPAILANLLFVQTWGLPVHTIVSDSWSVSTEVFAYLLFPALLFLSVTSRIFIAACLCIAAIFSLIFITHTDYGVNGPLDAYRNGDSLLPLLRCVSEFSLGLVAFRISRLPSSKKLFSNNNAVIVVLLFLIATVFLDKTDLLTVTGLFFLILCLSFNSNTALGLFGNKLVHHLGEISYSLYLLHPFFVGVAGRYNTAVTAKFGTSWSPLFLILGIAATWFTAYLSYRFIEVPARRHLHKHVKT